MTTITEEPIEPTIRLIASQICKLYILRVEDIRRPSLHPAAIAFAPCALLAYICVCDYKFTPQQTAYFLKLSHRKFDILFERAKKLIKNEEHPLSVKREIVLEILKTNQRYKRIDNEDNR